MRRGVLLVVAFVTLAACVSVPPSGPPSGPPTGPTPPSSPPPQATAAPSAPTPSPPPSATVISPGDRQQAHADYLAEVLAGWRAPTAAERAGAAFSATAEGDFDGDRVPDRADILVNPQTNEYALFLFAEGDLPTRVIVGSPLSEVRAFSVVASAPLTVELAGARYLVGWNGQRFVLTAAN